MRAHPLLIALGPLQMEGLIATLRENNERQETPTESFSLASGKYWAENTSDALHPA